MLSWARILAGCLLAASASLVTAGDLAETAASRVRRGPALGLMLDGPGRLPAADPESAGRPWVRLVLRWSDAEAIRGRHEWAGIESTLRAVEARGMGVTLCLTGANPLYPQQGAAPSPLDAEAHAAWLEFVRAAAREFAGRVAVFEIWDGPGGAEPLPAETYAFLLKSSALAIRSEIEQLGADAAVAQGYVRPGRWDWQRAMWEADSAAYVDVLPLRLSPQEFDAVEDHIRELIGGALQFPPAPAVWVQLEADGVAASPLAAAVQALGTVASVVLVEPADVVAARWLVGLNDELAGGFDAAPRGRVELRGARLLGRFFDVEGQRTLLVYSSAEAAGASLVLDTALARDVRVFDPLDGTRRRVPSSVGPAGRAVVSVPPTSLPLAVVYRRPAGSGPELPPEDLEVARTRGLTAEEIIARHQQVQGLQSDRLDRWTARGRTDYHFKLGQVGGTFDVSVESNYYWERDGSLEWELTDFFINGNRVTWKKIPELPFFQPEKVATVPLDLTLDRTYTYRRQGDDVIDGRSAYVLAFEPAEQLGDQSLYRGRVWIDRETFVRLRVSVIQTNLEPPVISNEERSDFVPVPGAEDERFWLLNRTDGQQIWTVAGRNFVVLREVTLTDFEVNPARDAFVERRAVAYASNNQMMRETDEGNRYLERQDDGSRTVKSEANTDQLFVAAGAFKDNSVDNVLPLAGVNYFNYDLWHKGIQANVFFAGAFAFLNVSKPDAFGGRADATAESTLTAFKRTDKVFVGTEEVVAARVRFRTQSITGRLGFPLGQFVKLTLVGDLDFATFHHDDDARDALAQFNQDNGTDLSFVLPVDHRVASVRTLLEFNRQGFNLSAQAAYNLRSDWQPWGLFDNTGGDFVDSEFDPDDDRFALWGVTLFKEWYLPRFQKIRGEVNWLDGSNLDRFSQYRFSGFGGTALAGFGGSGVRFDTGTIARLGYSFNLLDVIRFVATVETAWVENERFAVGIERHSGVGLSGNFVGPWRTIIALGYGVAIDSDVPELEGEQEFQLVVLKLF